MLFRTRATALVQFQLTMPSTCIISILRLQSIYVVSISPDITWENPLAAIWSSSECNFGIICSCLPTLKGCVTRFYPRPRLSASSANRQIAQETRGNSEDASEWQGTDCNLKTLELLGSYEFEFRTHVHPCEREESWGELKSLQAPKRLSSAPTAQAFVPERSNRFDFETHVRRCDSVARSKVKQTEVYQPTGTPNRHVRVNRYSWPLEVSAKEDVESQAADTRMPRSKFRSWFPAK
jgi:hypothetical protein